MRSEWSDYQKMWAKLTVPSRDFPFLILFYRYNVTLESSQKHELCVYIKAGLCNP